MLIINCQCLSLAWLYFVLSSAANYSNIFQSNEVPYVPEFLSLHSELQTYFMISELAWTKQVLHHMPSSFQSVSSMVTNSLCEIFSALSLESNLGHTELKARNESGSTTEKSPLKIFLSPPFLLSLIISLSLTASKTKSLYFRKEDNVSRRFLRIARGKDFRSDRKGHKKGCSSTPPKIQTKPRKGKFPSTPTLRIYGWGVRSPSSSESFDSRPLLKRTLPTAPTLSHCCKQDWSSFTLIASASNGKILTGKLFSVSRTAVLRIRRSLQSLSTHSHLACISTLKGYIAQPLSSHTFMYRARLVNSLKSHWNRLRTLKKCLPKSSFLWR